VLEQERGGTGIYLMCAMPRKDRVQPTPFLGVWVGLARMGPVF